MLLLGPQITIERDTHGGGIRHSTAPLAPWKTLPCGNFFNVESQFLQIPAFLAAGNNYSVVVVADEPPRLA